MRSKAVLALLLGAILAGTAGLFIKSMATMDATSISGIRMGLPALILWFYLKSKKVKIFRGNYKKMLGASTLNAFRLYFFFVAYIYTSIGNAVILFYTYPLWVQFFEQIFLKEKLSKRQSGYLLLSFIGLVIAYSGKEFTFDDRDFIGMLASLISAAVYALTIIIFKSESKNFNSTEMVFYQNFVGAFVFVPFFITMVPIIAFEDILICIGYTALIGLVVFKLFFIGLHHLKASVASTIMYLEIVSAIVLSYIFLGEELSISMTMGGALILVSSFMVSRTK